jgi:ribosomal protein S18 acetylase RimI-like enzyme
MAEWVELADRNLIEFERLGALWDRRGEVETRNDLQLVASGTRFPAGMFNAAHPLRAPADADEARAWLAQASAFFAARGRGFSVYIRGERDRALADACVARGMVLGGSPPGMLLAQKLPEPELPAGTRIDRVADGRALVDFTAVAAAGFGLHGLPAKVAQQILGDATRALSPELAFYLAYVDERPAATAISLLSHGIAGLYWIASLPELHRRGLGSAITRRASNDAFDAGAGAVILQASTHGEPVYRRLGYRTLVEYRWYFMTAEEAALA